eukprot:TRINITY_DN29033_c0_g1_i1.p1 TRINITY_DN29033_c0_g1~~TRINITY_DN29033_c0_g1_i1.p1  ORF type:complete len:1420 (-),score=169.11 TRINITY_DN29033_c0_g1_i1:175-4434(-)
MVNATESSGVDVTKYKHEVPEPAETYVARTVLPALQVALEDLVRLELERAAKESESRDAQRGGAGEGSSQGETNDGKTGHAQAKVQTKQGETKQPREHPVSSYTDVHSGMGLRTTPPGGMTLANELLQSAPKTLRYRQFLLRQLSSLLKERNAVRKAAEAEQAAREAADPRFRGLNPDVSTLRIAVCGALPDVELELQVFEDEALPQLRVEAERRGRALINVDLLSYVDERFAMADYLETYLTDISRADILVVLRGEAPSAPITISDAVRAKFPELEGIETASLEELQLRVATKPPESITDHRPQVLFFIRGTEFNDHGSVGAPTPGLVPASQLDRSSPEEQRYQELIDTLRSHGRYRFIDSYDPRTFGQQVAGEITALLLSAYPGELMATPADLAGYQSFVHAHRNTFIEPPAGILDTLSNHASDPDGNILFLSGDSGSGKTSTLVQWAEQHAESHPDALVVRHYASGFVAGTNAGAFALGVIQRIQEHFGITHKALPLTVRQALDELDVWLALASECGRVVLVIDDYDLLAASNPKLLPSIPPLGVSVICSVRPDTALVTNAAKDNIQTRVTTLDPWTGPDKERLFEAWHRHFNLSFTPKMRKRILGCQYTSKPGMMVAVLHDLSDRGEATDAILRTYTNNATVEAAWDHILKEIEVRVGSHQEIVGQLFTLLTSTRIGLSREEISQQLRCPGAVLSRLLTSISPYILRRALDGSEYWHIPSHSSLDRVISDRYSHTDEAQTMRAAVLEYFQSIAPVNSRPSHRVCLELPALLLRAGELDDAVAFVSAPETFRTFYSDVWYGTSSGPRDPVLFEDLLRVRKAALSSGDSTTFTDELLASVERLRANVTLTLDPAHSEDGEDNDASDALAPHGTALNDPKIKAAADAAAAELYQLVAAFCLELGDIETASLVAREALVIYDKVRSAGAIKQGELEASPSPRPKPDTAASRTSLQRPSSKSSTKSKKSKKSRPVTANKSDRASTPLSRKSVGAEPVDEPAPAEQPYSWPHALCLSLVAEISRRKLHAQSKGAVAGGADPGTPDGRAESEQGIQDPNVPLAPGDEAAARLQHAFSVLAELTSDVLNHGESQFGDLSIARLTRVSSALGNLHRVAKNYGEQDSVLRKVYAVILASSSPRAVASQVSVLFDLAEVQLHLEKLSDHAQFCETLLDLVESKYGTDTFQRALLGKELSTAVATGSKKDYALAREELESSATITGEVCGPRSARHAAALDRLASFLTRRKKYEEALLATEQLAALRVATVGDKHEFTADAWSRAANLCRRSKRVGALEEGVKYGERALAVYKEVHGEDHSSTAAAAHILGLVHAARNNLKGAAILFDRALKTRKALLGANSVDVARTRLQLAYLRARQGQFELAIPLGQTALSALSRALGESHRDTKEANDLLEKIKDMSKTGTLG